MASRFATVAEEQIYLRARMFIPYVWYILKHFFFSVSVKVVDISVPSRDYSSPLRE